MAIQIAQLMPSTLEKLVEDQRQEEYMSLLLKMESWEEEYRKKYFYCLKEENRTKKGLVFLDGKPYWDQMEKTRIRVFGQAASNLFIMHLFADGNKVLQAARSELDSHVRIL